MTLIQALQDETLNILAKTDPRVRNIASEYLTV
jgi:hypothetical protein